MLLRTTSGNGQHQDETMPLLDEFFPMAAIFQFKASRNNNYLLFPNYYGQKTFTNK